MKITINGRPIEVSGRKSLLEVAREKGIFIPSLCDHPDLVPFGGCRLCLVEIKGRRGFPPACSTFVEEGMDVVTETPELRAMRRQVLELILSEHPHACLICSEKKNCDEYKSTIRKVGEVTGCVLCPKNGRCELQEVVEAVGLDRVSFPALYREFDIRREDPFFDRNYNLCILCGRCVRVCHEVRGASAISFVFRGSRAVVGTAFDRPLLESGCQFCGACVDVCPTGALTERAVRGELLPDNEREAICPLCSLGCELSLQLKDGRILSSGAGSRESWNRGQVCVRGRFLVRDVVYSPRRILHPLLRRKGHLEEASWEEALDFVAGKLKGFKGDEIAVVGSPQVSLEDLYALFKFSSEVLATDNFACLEASSPLSVFIDEWRAVDLQPELNFEMKSLAEAGVILVAGADLAMSHPVIWLGVYEALRKGARLIVLDNRETSLERHASIRLVPEPQREFELIDRLCQRVLEISPPNPPAEDPSYETWRELLTRKTRSLSLARGSDASELDAAARALTQGGEVIFFIGASLAFSEASRLNLSSLWNLAQLAQARVIPLPIDINERACLELWLQSKRRPVFLEEVYERARAGEFRALYLAGPLPDLPEAVADFVVVQDSHLSFHLGQADAVLPATTFVETKGTFINAEGRIQAFEKIIEPPGQARADWWIITSLARRMGARGFQFQSVTQIAEEIGRPGSVFEPLSSPPKKGKAAFLLESRKDSRLFITGREGPTPARRSSREDGSDFWPEGRDRYRSLNLREESRGLRRLREVREK